MKAWILGLYYLFFSPLLDASTLSVHEVWQPLSLHGTDVDGVSVAKDSGVKFAVVMSRPMVISGAMPENLVHAVALPHRMPAIGLYRVPEANLVQLYNIQVVSEYRDKVLQITMDLTHVKTKKGMEIGLLNSVKLTIRAIKSTLKSYAMEYLREDMSVRIKLVLPEKSDPRFLELNQEFILVAQKQ